MKILVRTSVRYPSGSTSFSLVLISDAIVASVQRPHQKLLMPLTVQAAAVVVAPAQLLVGWSLVRVALGALTEVAVVQLLVDLPTTLAEPVALALKASSL